MNYVYFRWPGHQMTLSDLQMTLSILQWSESITFLLNLSDLKHNSFNMKYVFLQVFEDAESICV